MNLQNGMFFETKNRYAEIDFTQNVSTTKMFLDFHTVCVKKEVGGDMRQ